MIEITDDVRIAADELTFRASRSAGPGGQHVNKTSSRITLRFDVDGSPSLDDAQRATLRQRLPTRITKGGVLWVHAQRHRSQARNRDAAIARFVELVREALTDEAPRKPTRVPRGVHRRRLDDKRRIAEKKRRRKVRYDPHE